jgi:hypothetical protein
MYGTSTGPLVTSAAVVDDVERQSATVITIFGITVALLFQQIASFLHVGIANIRSR